MSHSKVMLLMLARLMPDWLALIKEGFENFQGSNGLVLQQIKK